MAFEDCRLFWSFKGFKYSLVETDDRLLERTLQTKVNAPFPLSDFELIHHLQVEGMFNMPQIDENDFHIDLGFMYGLPSQASDVFGNPQIGYTTLPRQCCLKDIVKRFDALILDAKGALKIKGMYYTWGLTKDVASLTIDIPPNHPFREIGLSYLQIYPSHKNLFECQAHYPYPLDDDSGVCLALDDHTLKSIYSIVGPPVLDRGICRSSCKHSGGRVAIPMQSHFDKSYFTRMELRVTQTLKRKIDAEMDWRHQLREVESVKVLALEAGCSFYIQETKETNNFITASTQVPARLFQEIVSFAPEGSLSIDHQKLLVQVFQIQKVMHSGVFLPKFKYLFNSIIRVKPTPQEVEEGVENLREELDMGLKETIEAYGYGYPKHSLIDWVELNFSDSEIAERFPQPSHALSNIITRPDDQRLLKDLFQEIDFIIGRFHRQMDEEAREILIKWLARRLLKQFHIDVTIYMIKGPYKFINKEQHTKNVKDCGNEKKMTNSDHEWHPSESEV